MLYACRSKIRDKIVLARSREVENTKIVGRKFLRCNASVFACRSRVRDKIVLARSREIFGKKFLRCMLVSLLVRRSRVIVLASKI